MSDFDDFQAENPDGAKGGGPLKYCLICGCLLALLMGIGGVAMVAMFQDMLIMDPVRVEQNLQETIACEVPDGYGGMFAMNMMGMKMSVIGPAGMAMGQQNQQAVPLMIIAMQVPPGQNPQAAKQQMQQQMNQGGMGNANMQVEDEGTLTLTIRGQDVECQEQVGVQNGQKMRQVMCIVDKAADDPTQVILMFMGAPDQFDEDAMRAFAESIK
jgi:hypothetical protein